ncbi:hypothetical protein FSP39_005953 [Pinctada imbricata]|uniref:Uncharacterized protein n=1 Tax=Pinctada imbricata TaxID=66713 RepID=A0AA88YL44_PINIB|nr:hypothetical protein FSP39_005953 [Pinctada imbricata]
MSDDIGEQLSEQQFYQEETTPDVSQSGTATELPHHIRMYPEVKAEMKLDCMEIPIQSTPETQKDSTNIQMIQNLAHQVAFDRGGEGDSNVPIQMTNFSVPQPGSLMLNIDHMDSVNGGDGETVLTSPDVSQSGSNVVSTTPIIQIETVGDSRDKVGEGSSGMYPPPDAITQPCMICGDKGSGFHYSVFSCEGCKGFFKRSVQKNLIYSCKNDGECSINKFTRNNCQYCRFVKCSQMGMKREAVREDRSPGGKHRHKRPKLDEVTAVVNSEGNVIFQLPATQDSNIFEDKIVEGLIDAQPDLIPRVEGNLGLQNLGINQLMQYGYAELKYIIDWAKRVPGFPEICIEDQMALLKSSFMELNVLRLAFRSQNSDDEIMFAEGLRVPVDLAQRMGWGKELINATVEFGQRLKILSIDKTEFAILNGIVLTYPDAAGLKEKHKVTLLQTKILNSLGKYQRYRFPENPKRYGQTLLRLPSLRTVSAKAAERFLSLTLDGTVQINDLVLEMIN